MEDERILVFNHYYTLKHDLKRTYIYSNSEFADPPVKVDRSWLTKIHPVYAMLFSLVSEPIKLSELIENISYFFDITTAEAKSIFLPFLDREEPFHSNFGGVVSQFPRNVIIEASDAFVKPTAYTPEEFTYDSIDLDTPRAYKAPFTVVFMPNNNCTTNCEYCYADRSVKPVKLDFEKVKSIVDECKKLRIAQIILTGGDIFLYKYWKELLSYLNQNDFSLGLLSTKTPLQLSDVHFLKEYKLKLQFSLDSIDPVVSKNLIGMDNRYLERVKKTFEIFDLLDQKCRVTTVITSLNADIPHLIELYRFLIGFDFVSEWEIRLASKSLYSKKNFDDLNITKEDFKAIDQWITSIQPTSSLKISWEAEKINRYFKSKSGSKSFEGARCSANYSNMMILPDGKVTICEQLYWNPNYIIGDLTKQSVTEVWNSKKALQLAFPKQEDFRNASPCKTCKIFDVCYSYPNRCIVDVIKGYGVENADYPDPRCDKAPQFITKLIPV